MKKIISGGQTGADRGGLDAAIKLNIEHGGWCPKNRRSEDGSIPYCYKLKETVSSNYKVRTEQNVIDSDLTLIFTPGKASGGSLQTIRFAKKHSKNYYHIDIFGVKEENFQLLVTLLCHFDSILNIAGSRESKFPGIKNYVKNMLCEVIEHINQKNR
ncbi:putative molybdenum carrier protein [Candidatus Uabimicrobium sp. HlEnr_7]|uniref:putative molybdenum carrier protein n=1 Tax=Candidatus Uabimicrobium helgolandensis TaxID=3095367 RepID=UPI003558A75A